MSDLAIRVRGLDELARELRRIEPQLAKELQKAHKQVATEVAGKASSAVAGLSGSGPYARAAAGIRPRAKANAASIVLLASNAYVRAAVFGTNVHWVFGRPVPARSMARRVWDRWVGGDWSAEDDLYGVSPAIREAMPNVIDTYADRIAAALSKAFPD